MGINGSATCVLNFGENDACVGELVGTVEHQGMPQMFQMMNGARIAVGLQGLAVGVGRVPERARVRARSASRARASRSWQGPDARRACRSSSTPTCAACCST